MFASKYYKYVGVATGCVGLGVALKYVNSKDDIDPEFKRAVIATVDAEVEQLSNISPLSYDFSAAINDSRRELLRTKEVTGTPGVSIAVNVDGRTVWSEGVGLADVENDVPCSAKTIMRIASISKSITMAVLARLWQEGAVDLDKPVQEYVPNFPVLSFEGEMVDITTRMLVSHLSGIRHYKKKKPEKKTVNPEESSNDEMPKEETANNENTVKQSSGTGDKKSPDSQTKSLDAEIPEMFLPVRFSSVQEALNIFKNDELFHKPGSQYHYTTYGWTLISAVIESIQNSTFPVIMREFFNQMGLHNTCLDYNESIVYHRARFYTRNKKNSRLENGHIVDNSYKWAGGGFLSNVEDLTKFADMMLYCFQQRENDFPGYLTAKTVEELWSVKTTTPHSLRGSGYGMGWAVVPRRYEFGWGDKRPMAVYHTGGAVGASSVLLVLPRPNSGDKSPPRGITVAILGNLDGVDWEKTASVIAQKFERVVSPWW